MNSIHTLTPGGYDSNHLKSLSEDIYNIMCPMKYPNYIYCIECIIIQYYVMFNYCNFVWKTRGNHEDDLIKNKKKNKN